MKNNDSNYLITSRKRMKKIVKKLAALVVLITLISNVSNAQTLKDAIKHLDAERYIAASEAFNKIATAEPTPENLFYKGYGILKSPEGTSPENLKLAQAAFEAGNAASKRGDDLCQIGMGMIKLAQKDVAGAKVIFEDVKKSTRLKDTEVLYRIAEAYTMFPGSTDAAEAIINIDMAIEKSKVKDNPEYFIVKSDAFLLKNEGGDAMNALVNAERTGQKLGKVYAKMSRIWLQGRNYKEASETIAKGIAADPTHAPIHLFESSYKQTMGKYGEAATAARNYLNNSDGDCKAKLRYSKLLFVAKRYDDVKKAIEDIKKCTNDPYIFRMIGIMDFEEGRPDAAIAALKTFIDKIPSDESPAMDYGYIGRSYMSKPGEGAERTMFDSLGIMNIEKAIKLGDTTFNYYSDLAANFIKTRNYPKAALYAEKDLKNNKKPNAADVATVGTYFSAARNWKKAEFYIDSALVMYGPTGWKDGLITSAKIKTYANSADSVYNANFSAAPAFEKYLNALTPEDKASERNIANISLANKYLAGRELQVNKNLEKAKEYFMEILKVNPNDEEAKSAVEALTLKPEGGNPPPPVK